MGPRSLSYDSPVTTKPDILWTGEKVEKHVGKWHLLALRSLFVMNYYLNILNMSFMVFAPPSIRHPPTHSYFALQWGRTQDSSEGELLHHHHHRQHIIMMQPFQSVLCTTHIAVRNETDLLKR